MDYRIVSLAERPELFEIQDKVAEAEWPEFMLHDPVANVNWMTFVRAFPKHQLMLMSGEEIIAVLNSVPIRFDRDFSQLPDRGWDWSIMTALEGQKAGHIPNLMIGLQIVIGKSWQGKGLARKAIGEMAALAKRSGYTRLAIPVRPSEKHRYPLIPMEDYLSWTVDEGLPYDSWLRVHVRCGASIIRVSNQAMEIPGTIAEWSKWTGLTFPGSGRYIIPGALNPVDMDIENDLGVYKEPNVWVIHEAR